MKTFLLGMIISCVIGVALRKHPRYVRVVMVAAVSAWLCFAYFFLNQI